MTPGGRYFPVGVWHPHLVTSSAMANPHERPGSKEPDLQLVTRGLTKVLGGTPPAWTAEPLTHNRLNQVTAGIWRVRWNGASAVVKVLADGPVAEAPAGWEASDDPTHWNYWRREARVYVDGLPEAYADSGCGAPRLLAADERPGRVALWLEDVVGTPGSDIGVDGIVAVAGALGRAQGRLSAGGLIPQRYWLSRRFLRDYIASKRVDRRLLDNDDAWRQPLVADAAPTGLRRAALRLRAERSRLLQLIESMPRTLAHLDAWPNNVVLRPDGEPVLLDWAFAGDGAIAEDVGNLVPDSVFDLFLPAARLPELDAAVFEAYRAGLRTAGWHRDDRWARLAMCASAVKYEWLAPLMIADAGSAQGDYGGERAVDAPRRFAERGAALVFLESWVDEALHLARRLGV